MANASVTTTGLTDMRAGIAQLPTRVTAALRAVAWRTSRRVYEGARSRVAVDTGYTRDNISVTEDAANQQFIVSAGTDRPRVRFSLHRMTRSGRIHTQKVTLNMLPIWLEYGTRKMTARPFMRPAAEAESETYKREMEHAAIEAAREALG